MKTVTRSGSIYRFGSQEGGPSPEDFPVHFSGLGKAGVPVEVIDAETGDNIGLGSLVSAYAKDGYLVGDIKWSESIEEMDSGEKDPESQCVFNRDGSLKKVIVEIHTRGDDSEEDSGEDSGNERNSLFSNTNSHFRKWDQAARDALPPEDFAGPNQTFPIDDQDDVDSAAKLVGRAKNKDTVIAKAKKIIKRKGLTLPESWQEKPNPITTNMSGSLSSSLSAKFSATLTTDDKLARFSALIPTDGKRIEGDYTVFPSAILFEAGDYADKKFSMSREELYIAADTFSTPLGGNIEHTDFLKGRACQVRSVRIDPSNPDILRGEVAVPTALDNLLNDQERRLSCEWNRGLKELSGLALTLNPRIKKAALMASFKAGHPEEIPDAEWVEILSEVKNSPGFEAIFNNIPGLRAALSSDNFSSTWGGMRIIQDLHDKSAEAGAMCREYGDDSRSGMGGQSSKMSLLTAGDTDTNLGPAASTASFHTASELDSLQKIHDASCQGGAKCRTLSDDEMAKRRDWYSNFAKFTDRVRSEHADKHHQLIHDVIATGYPETCTGGLKVSRQGVTAVDPDDPTGMAGGSKPAPGWAGTPDILLSEDIPLEFKDHPEQIKALRSIHETTCEHGAKCPGRMTNMSVSAKFADLIAAVRKLGDTASEAEITAVFRMAPPEILAAASKPVTQDKFAKFKNDPEFAEFFAEQERKDKANQDRIAKLEGKQEADRIMTLGSQVADFVDKHAARLLLDPETTEIFRAALFAASEMDKSETGVVAFTVQPPDGSAPTAKTVKLANAFKAIVESLPDSPYANQIVDGEGQLPAEFKVLRMGGQSAADEQKEADELLSKSEAGRQVLEMRKQKKQA